MKTHFGVGPATQGIRHGVEASRNVSHMKVKFAEKFMPMNSSPSRSARGIHMFCPPAFKRLVVSQYFDAMTHDPALIAP